MVIDIGYRDEREPLPEILFIFYVLKTVINVRLEEKRKEKKMNQILISPLYQDPSIQRQLFYGPHHLWRRSVHIHSQYHINSEAETKHKTNFCTNLTKAALLL